MDKDAKLYVLEVIVRDVINDVTLHTMNDQTTCELAAQVIKKLDFISALDEGWAA